MRSTGIRHLENGSCVLENSLLRVTLHPWLGGKITNITEKSSGFQPVFQSGTQLCRAQLFDAFEAYDTSGIDDAFPTVIEESVPWQGRLLHLPDHGEIWSSNLECRVQDETVSMDMDSKIQPVHYQKIVGLEENAVRITYRIHNMGEESCPCLWTFHGLFAYHPDMQILLPPEIQSVRHVTDSEYFGGADKLYSFPKAEMPDGSIWDFHRVLTPEISPSVKFWFEGKILRGNCGFQYPHLGRQVQIEYDSQKLPYLGLWIAAGGFKGEYNCALEPSNGYYDSVTQALSNHKCPVLAPGESLDFTIRIRILPY